MDDKTIEVLKMLLCLEIRKDSIVDNYYNYKLPYASLVNMNMFNYFGFDKPKEFKDESPTFIRKNFKGLCTQIAISLQELFIKKAYNIHIALVLPLKVRRKNSNEEIDELLWSPYSDCGIEDKEMFHSILVLLDTGYNLLVVDPLYSKSIMEFNNWITMTAKKNKLTVKDFRYDTGMLVDFNVCGFGRYYFLSRMLNCIDFVLGVPQYNILFGKKNIFCSNDFFFNEKDKILNVNMKKVILFIKDILSFRVHALTNSKFKCCLREGYYLLNCIDTNKISLFSNEELELQNIGMYCDLSALLYAMVSLNSN